MVDTVMSNHFVVVPRIPTNAILAAGLQAVVKDGYAVGKDAYFAEVRAAYLAMVARAEPACVKPLSWIVCGGETVAYAAAFGHPRYYRIVGTEAAWTLCYPHDGAIFLVEAFETQIAARRAAQAHYEGHILSGLEATHACLTPTPERPRPALNHDLLERCLPLVICEAISTIESCSNLAWDGSDHIPIMGACSPEGIRHAEPLLDLIREIESEIGPTESPEPDWFESLIDGQWKLSSEIYATPRLPEIDAPTPQTICQTCDGTGKEGRHSICRDCDGTPTPETSSWGDLSKILCEFDVREYLETYSWVPEYLEEDEGDAIVPDEDTKEMLRDAIEDVILNFKNEISRQKDSGNTVPVDRGTLREVAGVLEGAMFTYISTEETARNLASILYRLLATKEASDVQ